MKKLLSLLLCAVLCFSLASAALAAPVVQISGQSLSVNGSPVNCEKYNIDGANYFKLRDLAYLLNGTASQFSVGWDAANGVIAIVTGEAYEPVGGELVVGADNSASAVPSAQTLMIDGVVRSDLSAYNIGGNNYFKLRDLGGAVGFDVDYDEATKTMLVSSAGAEAAAEGWWVRVKESFDSNVEGEHYFGSTEHVLNAAGFITEEYVTGCDGEESYLSTYNEQGFLTSRRYTNGDYWTETGWTLDEAGNELVLSYADSDGFWMKTETVYDEAGNEASCIITGAGDLVEEMRFTYDENGNQLCMEDVTNGGTAITGYDYDEDGNLLSIRFDDGNGYWYEDTFTYDEKGNITSEVFRNDAIEWTESYAYDEEGRVIRTEYRTPAGWSIRTSDYDEAGNEILYRNEYEDGWDQEDKEYDAYGNLLRGVYTDSEGNGFEEAREYQYDKDGNVLAEKGYWNGELDHIRENSYDENGNGIRSFTTYYYKGEVDYTTELAYEYAHLTTEEQYENYLLSYAQSSTKLD